MFFRVKTKGPVKLCKFFSNLFHNALGIQVAGLLHSVTEVASQVFLLLLLRVALHEVELKSTFRNGLQQLAVPLRSNLSRNFEEFSATAHAYILFEELWVRDLSKMEVSPSQKCGNIQPW